jgi:ribonucleoside-diphosphate reductase alpha chain
VYGIGNDHVNVSLSNCVVVESPKDNISSIVDSGKHLANLFKRRCGVGVDISELRPENAPVNNSAGTTTGAWSFADFYSYVCRMIGQNGRRGALMISMDVRHPDIERFITMKQDLTKVTGANVSVKISDDFMQAVEEDRSSPYNFQLNQRNLHSQGLLERRKFGQKSLNLRPKLQSPVS